jgi:hypothetical protein
MRDEVDFTTTRMMTWRARAMVPTVVLLVLALVPPALRLGDGWTVAFEVVAVLVLLWAVPLWLALTAAVIRTPQRAFGTRAGLGYAALLLASTPLFGAGVFAVLLLVRADLRRLLGAPRNQPRE